MTLSNPPKADSKKLFDCERGIHQWVIGIPGKYGSTWEYCKDCGIILNAQNVLHHLPCKCKSCPKPPVDVVKELTKERKYCAKCNTLDFCECPLTASPPLASFPLCQQCGKSTNFCECTLTQAEQARKEAGELEQCYQAKMDL